MITGGIRDSKLFVRENPIFPSTTDQHCIPQSASSSPKATMQSMSYSRSRVVHSLHEPVIFTANSSFPGSGKTVALGRIKEGLCSGPLALQLPAEAQSLRSWGSSPNPSHYRRSSSQFRKLSRASVMCHSGSNCVRLSPYTMRWL